MKRYLTGIDWFINGLDYAGRRACGIGNISQVVLELEGRLKQARVRECLKVLEKIPVIYGYPTRALNLCPYWRIDSKNFPLALNTLTLKNGLSIDDVLSALGDEMNKPFRNAREHLVFNLIEDEKKSFLGMVFDHRLLAARGAEGFANILSNGADLSAQALPYSPANLNQWVNKFKAGRKVNRLFLSFSESRIRSFPQIRNNYKSNFSIARFNLEESAKIAEDSCVQAGYLMLMPYLLAKSIIILDRIFEQRNLPRYDYLIPVSVDKRPQGLVSEGVFFNHLSFLFFRVKREEVEDPKLLLASIKKQMYDQVKAGLPEAIAEASFLLRIAPLALLNLLVRLMSRTEVASFSFSFIGESVYNSTGFMDNKILNIFHLPRVPYPPGVGIFFNQFQGKLNASLSYIEGLLSEDEVREITADLKSLV